MFMPNESLRKFSKSVSCCLQTETLEAVRSIFLSGNYDVVVVVNENQAPQGSIYLHSLLPYMLSDCQRQPRFSRHSREKRENTKISEVTTTQLYDWQKSLQFLEPPILRTLKVLPANLGVAELISDLKNWEIDSIAPDFDRYPIALVDEQGKFVGLLDSFRLLAFIAQNQNDRQGELSQIREFLPWQENNLKKVKPSLYLEDNPKPPQKQVLTETGETMRNSQKSSSLIACPLSNNWQEETKVEKCDYFTSIVEILEQLPVPMMVQNHEGIVLSQNRAWRSQVGADTELAETVATGIRLSQLQKQKEKVALKQPVAIATSKQARASVSLRSPNSDGLKYESNLDCPLPPTSNQEDSNSFPQSVRGDGYVCFCSLQAGQEQVWQFAYQPLFDLSLILAQDITEKHLVAQELEAKNADLIQLNRLKDEFLACITHELKTPLTAVLGLSNLLKSQAIGKLNDRQARYAKLIHDSGRHLMTVVNDILDLTRIETGQMELTPQPVKIREVCDRAYKETLELRTKGATDDTPTKTQFIPEIEPGLEMLVADELRLRQMLVNLLSNALKFTPIGGKIGLKVSRWERWIVFTVWDTGIGIPAEKQHLIFQKFQQLESPLTRQFEGTGLGLVLTQRLARLHGGDVSFISKEKKGSEFTLLLPPSPPTKSLANYKQADHNFSQQKLRQQKAITKVKHPSKLPVTNNHISIPNYSSRLALMVEAVPQYIEDLTEKLKGLGYQVVIARSGTEALEKVRRLQPKVIFLNPVLPVLSGWDLLTLLKTDPDTSHRPVIITATRGDKERALQQKADGFLSLPVQQFSLEKTLTESLKPLPYIPNEKLTILRLIYGRNQKSLALDNDHRSIYDLSLLLHPYDCRIVEADEIEEAELLAKIWCPDIVLLERVGNDVNCDELVENISKLDTLKSIPLVTLDARTTEVANKAKELSVFPCLDYEKGTNSKEKTENDSAFIASALWQVISIAARTNLPPNILVVDVSTIADFTTSSSKTLSEEAATISQDRQENISIEDIDGAGNLDSTQALIQYLEIAGFQGGLSRYWHEVLQHLQYHSIDLLLICLRGKLPSKLLEGLLSLKQLQQKSPIVVWEDANFTLPDNFTSDELNSMLGEIANQVLPSSTSMSDLLGHIKKAIYQSKVDDLETKNH